MLKPTHSMPGHLKNQTVTLTLTNEQVMFILDAMSGYGASLKPRWYNKTPDDIAKYEHAINMTAGVWRALASMMFDEQEAMKREEAQAFGKPYRPQT